MYMHKLCLNLVGKLLYFDLDSCHFAQRQMALCKFLNLNVAIELHCKVLTIVMIMLYVRLSVCLSVCL